MNVRVRADAPLPEAFTRWFASRGWAPRAHQLELLDEGARRALGAADRADRGGQDAGGVFADPGGVGAAATRGQLPPPLWRRVGGGGAARVARSLRTKGTPTPNPSPQGGGEQTALASRANPYRKLVSTGRGIRRAGGLHTLYISPLKALAVDIARNLERPVAEMSLPIRIETRTGDTPASKRQRQRRDPPDILLTTPEQLALLLASADAPYLFGSLRRVILDELHSLVMSKRGDLLSLGLARLFTIAPQLDHRRPLGDRRRAGRPAPLSGAADRRRRNAPTWCSPSPAPRPTSRCSTAPSGCPGPATPRATRSARSTR